MKYLNTYLQVLKSIIFYLEYFDVSHKKEKMAATLNLFVLRGFVLKKKKVEYTYSIL